MRFPAVIQRLIASRAFYPLVWLACAMPAAILLWRTYQAAYGLDPDALGVNPIKTLLHATGRDALALLLVTLTVTPIRRLTGWNRVQIVRRTLGVWSFVYAVSHLTIYFVFDQLGELRAVADDVLKRPFIFMGMLAFTILAILAATSTNGMIRRLGRRWQRIHRLVYVAAVAGVIHFTWGQKADIREPLEWAAYLMLLLGLRLVFSWRKRRNTLRRSVAPPARSVGGIAR
jgi:sulfoxide reductase heme-binding subunit YedZ